MFREIEYVYAVYQERSFTKAAQKMFLSQPALSSMVKKAEKKIGTPIFDRSTSPLRLTPAGEYYIEQAEKILRIQQETKDYFSRSAGRNDKLVRICGAAVYQAYVFPTIIADFREKNPDVTVLWDEIRTGLVQKLINNEADFFPEVNNYISREIDRVPWRDDELVLVVPSVFPINERLAEFRFTPGEIRDGKHHENSARAVDLRLFRDEQFCLMDETNDTCQRALSICNNAGFLPRTTPMTPGQMLTAYELAAQGSGCTFVSDTLVSYTDKNYPLFLYKLSDPLAFRRQYLYFLRGRELPLGMRIFRDYMAGYPSQYRRP